MRGVSTLPELDVRLDGRPIDDEAAAGLVSVVVRQRLAAPSQCEIEYEDMIARFVPTGTRLRVDVPPSDTPLFEGEVTAVEIEHPGDGTVRTRVRGYDPLHRLRKRQPVRSHAARTPADLARELAEPLGLSVAAAEAGVASALIVQYDRTDFDLLVDHAGRSGLYPVLRDGTLHLLTLEGTGSPIELVLGASLLRGHVEANSEPSCRTVSASGWDTCRVEWFAGRATVPRSGRDVPVDASPDRVGGADERILVDRIARDRGQAEAIAQAELDRRAAAEVVLSGVADGDPRLRPGTRVDARGLAEPFSGRYVLTEVTHSVDAESGFLSRFSTSPPHPRAAGRAAALAWGTVTRVDDPEGLGRVRATLPTYGDVETDWMTVLSLAAGAGKGWVALPDVGDRVLVAFVSGDPAQGIVLGGLFGSQSLPDSGVEEGAVRRFTFATPGGHRLQFDDARVSIRVQDTTGSFLEMTPGIVRLHAATPLEIEAPGLPITIRADTVDFQRG
ncbi:MAG TPA: phage baseplate assembly protein V [Gemmatimonadota bacterium]|nr:phage baseplate assembly protein V [Gemmatimonadota bacterium]